jgi:biopolymer transport protein TolR
MLRKRREPEKLFSDFNTLQFASVMGMVLFVILLVFMTRPIHGYGIVVDLPKVPHPIAMPGALREDVMKVAITRDGKVYLGIDRIADSADLTGKIQDRLKDRSVERKVYIVADMRAKWVTVKPVLDAVRAAGILRVAFLMNQRSS